MKKVYFVCGENACRSQMAEAFANHLAGERIAESAGTFPGERVNPLAVEVMAEAGIDIASARTKRFTLADIERFDRVISFGCIARAAFPVPEKLEDWLVEDPSGKDIDAFRAARDEIKKRVEDLLPELS